MKIISDFKASLEKGNALALSFAVALGAAVYGLAESVNGSIISPLLSFLRKLNSEYLMVGSLVLGIINFAVAVGVIYAVFFIVLPMLFGKASSDSTPPPPAPPVV